MTKEELDDLNEASLEYHSAKARAAAALALIDAELDYLKLEGDHRAEIRKSAMLGNGADVVDGLTGKIVAGLPF